MKWAAETPTKPGLYWFKTSKDWTPVIVAVTTERGSRSCGTFIGDDQPYRLPWDDEGQQWAGPLEAPQ